MVCSGLVLGGQPVLHRIITALALLAGIGLGGCVGLDKPEKVAACAARNNCSDEPGEGGGPGMGGGTASPSGGSTGVISSGGVGGGGTSVFGTGGQGGSAGGAQVDARGAGGALASGGMAIDASLDVSIGSGGAVGFDGAVSGSGGARDAALETGGVPGSGGKPGSGGTASGGTTSTGGNGSGGSTTVDARVFLDASPLLTGLVAYYTFDSISNSTDLPDSSSKGNTGKLSTDGSGTAYELVTGKVGKALALHRAGLGYVKVPSAVFASATDMTVALWVNVATSQNWQRVLDVGINAKLSQNTQTGTKYFNIVPKNDGSNMLFSITANGYGSEQTLSTANANTGTWTHVAVVLAAGNGGRLYVNGSQVTSNNGLSLRASDLGAIDYAFIGKSQFSSDPSFDGSVDEFRVYNRALSASEVQQLYAFNGS